MPRFKVTELRMHRATYEIITTDETGARLLRGEIVSEEHSDDWSYEIADVEQIEDEEEET